MSELLWDEFIYCHAFLDTFCAILKRWLLLKACCTLLVRCRCLYWRSFLPVVPGEQSGPSCWWDRAESHEPDPGLARRTETLQAVGDTWARVKREPKTETSLLPTQPSHCTGFSTRVGDPHACTAVFQVFPGSGLLTSCKPGSSPPGWYLK